MVLFDCGLRLLIIDYCLARTKILVYNVYVCVYICIYIYIYICIKEIPTWPFSIFVCYY